MPIIRPNNKRIFHIKDPKKSADNEPIRTHTKSCPRIYLPSDLSTSLKNDAPPCRHFLGVKYQTTFLIVV